MKLSISNIGWTAEQDNQVYEIMKQYGFCGLEIAPTRIFPQNPYDRLEEAKKWISDLKSKNDFCIPSMQSIWFGRKEKLFGTEEEREALVDYTRKAIDFAATVGCKNLVFGCPSNRNKPLGVDTQIGVDFFCSMGDYALNQGTVIGMEANPLIYNTNYINDTSSALQLIEEVGCKGFRLNLDVGTMIQNGERLEILEQKVHLINHVHISEPELKPIQKRPIHRQLRDILHNEKYQNFVSIEMGRVEDIETIKYCLEYVSNIFL